MAATDGAIVVKASANQEAAAAFLACAAAFLAWLAGPDRHASHASFAFLSPPAN